MLIHWPGSDRYANNSPQNRELRLETWNTLIKLQEEGKLRDIGVSNFLTHHLDHLL
jgi:diketogulonate reductase-like aldo/keto reductase